MEGVGVEGLVFRNLRILSLSLLSQQHFLELIPFKG